jgi:hypothetical protein
MLHPIQQEFGAIEVGKALGQVESAFGPGELGKPWDRLRAPSARASSDITVKMVVPTSGSLLVSSGVFMRVAF